MPRVRRLPLEGRKDCCYAIHVVVDRRVQRRQGNPLGQRASASRASELELQHVRGREGRGRIRDDGDTAAGDVVSVGQVGECYGVAMIT